MGYKRILTMRCYHIAELKLRENRYFLNHSNLDGRIRPTDFGK